MSTFTATAPAYSPVRVELKIYPHRYASPDGRPAAIPARKCWTGTVSCYTCGGTVFYMRGKVLLEATVRNMATAEGWTFTQPTVPFPRAFCTGCLTQPDPAGIGARPYIAAQQAA